MTKPNANVYMYNVQYTCDPKTAVTISNNYITQIFRQLLYTNLPTILPIINSQLFSYTCTFDMVFESSTSKFWKARGKRLKLLIVVARRDELSVRHVIERLQV